MHRDIKPGNLLIDQNCQVKLCDFGQARCMLKASKAKNFEGDVEMNIESGSISQEDTDASPFTIENQDEINNNLVFENNVKQ